ncbi:uncharacterized protein [Asterias amurensis]|uniref:uncharacterized protein n=1 Tax=Asterias amurensis TaxID=7602 RepID=UPI003AB8856B
MFKIPSDKKGSVGAFKWTYGVNSVITIRMRPTASLVPAFVSRTVNIGDDVDLTVTRNTADGEISNSKWRKDNGGAMNGNILDLRISTASPSDSGIYECHYRHERGKGNQALLRLIVRGCPQHKYGLTACSSACPRCLNGGVCDDVNGDCICPPGFGGRLCGEVKGPNRFGQKGSLRCDSVGLPHDGSTCKGMLFCLPDPYGCSCAAGYQGLECKTDCDDGTYGANCAQICHCADGVSCNGTTGRCDGDCAAGYKGDNCQVQCTSGEFGENCAHTCHCADAVSCDGTTGQCDGDCAAGYKGDNCQVCCNGKFGADCAQTCHCADSVSCDGTTGQCSGSCVAGYTGNICQESCVDGTFGMNCTQTCHCATEAMCDQITGRCERGRCEQGYTGDNCQEQCLPYGDNKLSCSTTCTILDPNMIPQRLSVSSYSADDSFTHTLSWEPVICPEVRFSIVNYVYMYEVLGGHESDVEPVEVEGTSVNLHLAHCTIYQIKVAAQTSKGIGNYGIVSYTTKTTVPNHVASVTVSPTSHNQLTVSWDTPLTDNQSHCPATDYLVTYDLMNLEQCEGVSRGVETLTTTKTTITITRLEAFSTYRVTVTSINQAGSSTPVSRTMTTTQSIPEAPTVTVVSASSDHIEFAWELPCGRTGGNITAYRYKYKKATDNEFMQAITTTDKRIRIASLTPCTSYVFQVRALNSIARKGTWSNETRQNTTQSEPLGIKNLNVKPDSQGRLTASWEDKGVGNTKNPCLASSYYVTYEIINLDQCGEGDQSGGSLNTTDTSTTVEGLHPYSTYRINVTSRNEAGDGPTKSKSAITTERSLGIVPTFNSSRVTYNTISITWNPIPCGSRGVRIDGYNVNLYRQGESRVLENRNNVQNTYTVQFDDLFPCTSYRIIVSALNTGKTTSSNRQEKTKPVAPEAVTGLNISRIQHDQLEVAWEAPDTNRDNPCLATDYLVTYELTNLEQCREVDQADISSLTTPETSIIIVGLKAYSKYRVNVISRNEAGNGALTTTSKITSERSPQAAPTCNRSEVTASSISITWNPIPCGSRGGSITGYRAELYLTGYVTGHASHQQSVDVRGTSVRFVNLSPCTSYTIIVTTRGSSEGTSFEREETTDIVAPGRVIMLRANPTSDATQIHVTWQNPNSNNCPVSKYTVEYQLTNRDQCDSEVSQNREQWLDGSQSPTNITGLYPHSTYIVYVTPSNNAGTGEEAEVTVISNNTAPSGPPRDVEYIDVTNQTMAFSWKQPACGQRNGIITQYHYRLIDSEEEVLDEDTTSRTGVEFTGLVPFTSYTLSVSAENQFGSGPNASNTAQTEEGIPPPPSQVTFPVTRSDWITVAWNAPSPSHGIIISYDIRFWKTRSGNQTLGDTVRITKQLSSQYQSKKISNLEESLSYSVQVRAETSIGHGPWSDTSTVTTKPGEPSQPRSLIATEITQTSITLSWEKPQYPNGKIVHYIVEHRVLARPYDRSFNFYTHSEFWSSKVLATSLIEVISDLEPSTQYEVRVQAVNNANMSGNISQVEVFTELPMDLTPPDKPALIGAESSVTHLTIRLASTNASKYTSSYQIGVKKIAGDSTLTGKISKRSAPEFRHYDKDPSAYIAAELPGRLPGKFVVGDNKTYGRYWNPPLQEGAVYEIYVGAVSRINETKASVVWNDEPLTVEVNAVTQIPPITRLSSLLIIVVCVAIAAAVVIVVGVIFYTRRRRKRRGRNPLQHPVVNAGQELVSYENAEPIEEKPTSAPTQRGVSLVQESVYEPVGPGSSAHGGALPAIPPSPEPESQPTYEDVGLPTWATPWSVLREDMIVGNKVLGNGHFGEVHYGGVMFKGDLYKAAIKKLKENALSADREKFLDELKTMTIHGSHPNLVKILGACQHEGILYVAMEYLSNGDLRCYLRKARSMENDGQASLSPQKLLQFALDVAKGMQHLAANGVIHRDLAARNILLDDNLNAKVSDFGLSRGEDVYVQTSKTRVPTRWLSLESLTHQTYTSMSDVWSFGILLWEIATLGGTPYPGIKTQSLKYRLQNGYRMPKPGNSDAKIYNLMLKCWQDNPDDRPSFKKLVSVLKQMADSNADQIYIRLLPSSNKYLYENIHPEFDDN